MSGAWLDRLALVLAARPTNPAPAPEPDSRLSRRELLRHGALGGLALATVGSVGVPRADASPAACVGGSLKGCNGRAQSQFRKALGFCGNDSPFVADVADRIACYREAGAYRESLRNSCKRNCPKKGSKPPGSGGGGGGGGSNPPGGNGSPPTCGDVSCVQGDKCCPLPDSPSGKICCAVCCAKNGNGCGSSESDC